MMTELLSEKLAQLPHRPGVYHYYNQQGDLLYIGKAKNLFKRVHSYWSKTHRSPWTDLLVSEIYDIKTIEVSTEIEALMLENSLIKSLKPKYNIQLKDDKTFPFLRLSKEDFPKFSITRKVKQDGAHYFGPYFSATYLRTMLKVLEELFGVKTVSEKSYQARSSVPQQIGLGARNLDSKDNYQKQIEAAVQFLSEPQPKMERVIKTEMQKAAENHEFERAAILRDKFTAIQQLRNSQSLFGTSHEIRDYVGLAQSGKLLIAYILFEREGKITNHRHFSFEIPSKLSNQEISRYILDYLYIQGLAIPKEINVAYEPDDKESLIHLLSEQVGKKVSIQVPQRGERKDRLATAMNNAEYQLNLERARKNRRENGLADLAKLLNLTKIPRRIEAFDISNLGATNIVGASIVFIDGQSAKAEYRKYKINTPEGQDDFASMRELVFRRVSNSDRALPDLLLIDGGKGQLSAAMDALKAAKKDIPLFSLAKKEELIYLPNSHDAIALAHDSDALLLVTAIRDEVHRFVISFHRQQRSKKLLS